MPDADGNTLHTAEDWRPYLNDFAAFSQAHKSHVPEVLQKGIFDAMQDVPRSNLVREQLTTEMAEAPTLQEFEYKIRKLKANSSPGPSGLSYNMIKKAPTVVIHEIYKCLEQFWKNKHIPAGFKWRWLVPIPKNPTDTPSLDELRPLMLCESLRKIWSALIISKIQRSLQRHKVLDRAQHGYQRGKGTSSASMIPINGLEDAEELGHELHRTSYDMKKAFDSVSKSLMLLAWQRLGVPYDVAQ